MTQQILSLSRATGFYGGVRVNSQEIAQIRSLTREGRTLDSIQQTLRDTGVGVRRQAISQIRNEFQQMQQRSPGIANIPLDNRPGRQTITPVNINLATRFRYSGFVDTVNPTTGQRRRFFARFGSDRPLTRRVIQEEMEDIFLRGQNAAPDGSGSAGFTDFGDFSIQSIEERG